MFDVKDQLPLESDVVLQIFEQSPGGSPYSETKKRAEAVNKCVSQLIEIWSKAFTVEHVLGRKAVAKRIRNSLIVHFKEVVVNKKRTKRQLENQWHEKTDVLFDLKKSTSYPEKFEPNERKFYFDQLNSRK